MPELQAAPVCCYKQAPKVHGEETPRLEMSESGGRADCGKADGVHTRSPPHHMYAQATPALLRQRALGLGKVSHSSPGID